MEDRDYFTVGPTSLTLPRSGCQAIFAGDKPRKNPDGSTSYSLRGPFLLMPPEMWGDQQSVIEKVARILNENAGAFFDSAGDDQRGAAAKLKRQKAQITGLAETVRKAKHTIRELKRKVRAQTAGETRDIEQLIQCNQRIENQRQEIARLRSRLADLQDADASRSAMYATECEDRAKAEAEVARLRALIVGIDLDPFGLPERVLALQAEALREGGA